MNRMWLHFVIVAAPLLLAPLADAQTNEAARADQTNETPRVALAEGVRDGMRIISGRVTPKAKADGVRMTVKRSAMANVLSRLNYVQQKSTKDIAADGAFTVTLDAPLIAGQVVIAEAMAGDQVIADSQSEPVEVVDPGSWGRARAYFAGGVVFSKERGDFSKQDLSVSFVIDKTWLQATDFQLGAPKAVRDVFQAMPVDAQNRMLSKEKSQPVPSPAAAPNARGSWRPRQLNSFFDARVTALPVVVEGDGSDVATREQFLGTRKGALVQVGIYAPVYGPQTAWEHDGAVHALFVAPVIRGGIATIPGSSDDNTDVSPADLDDVHQFWSIGVGVGLYRLTGTTNQAPELINYLHATWGHAEAFEIVENGTTRKPRRLFIEGRLMVPGTALQVGFDANLGDGRDDVKFVFGTRFDIGELIGRLSMFQ